jgi:hypothetical protein
MISLLQRALAMYYTWLGGLVHAPSLVPMTPTHGWLLPNASVLLAQRRDREPRMPQMACNSTLRKG